MGNGGFYSVYAFFLLAYFLTLVAFVLLLQSKGGLVKTYLTELSIGSSSTNAKWAALVSLLAFTGLPPFLLFFAKLGLLGWVLTQGGLKYLALALVFILVGWGVYSSAAIKVLNQSWALGSKHSTSPSPSTALLLTASLLIVCLGGLWVGDLLLLLA